MHLLLFDRTCYDLKSHDPLLAVNTPIYTAVTKCKQPANGRRYHGNKTPRVASCCYDNSSSTSSEMKMKGKASQPPRGWSRFVSRLVEMLWTCRFSYVRIQPSRNRRVIPELGLFDSTPIILKLPDMACFYNDCHRVFNWTGQADRVNLNSCFNILCCNLL